LNTQILIKEKMDIQGKLIKKLEPVTGTGKNGEWRKQDIVIETLTEYPKKICLTIWGDKIDLKSYQPGDQIQAFIEIESREWNNKWYTDVKAWRLEKLGDGPAEGYSQIPPEEQNTETIKNTDNNSMDGNDLPF
jgi:uncharacterized protein DUF3127